MYGKFVNDLFVRAPYRITEDEALAQGYKPVVLTPAPETDNDHYPREWLEERESVIIRHWNIVEMPPVPYEPTTEDKAEAYDILMGVSE